MVLTGRIQKIGLSPIKSESAIDFKGEDMKDIPEGILAGLVATLVLSALMVSKMMMGLMPQLDLAKMLATMTGSPDTPLVGWIVHFDRA